MVSSVYNLEIARIFKKYTGSSITASGMIRSANLSVFVDLTLRAKFVYRILSCKILALYGNTIPHHSCFWMSLILFVLRSNTVCCFNGFLTFNVEFASNQPSKCTGSSILILLCLATYKCRCIQTAKWSTHIYTLKFASKVKLLGCTTLYD